jgi:hypothetical protein
MIIEKSKNKLGFSLHDLNPDNEIQSNIISIPNQSFYIMPSYFDTLLTYNTTHYTSLGVFPISNRFSYFDKALNLEPNNIDTQRLLHPNTCWFLSDEDLYIGKNARITFTNDLFLSSNNYRAKIYLDDFLGETQIQSYNFRFFTEDQSVEIFTSSSQDDKFGDNLTININKIDDNFNKTTISKLSFDNLGNILIQSNLDSNPKSIYFNKNNLEIKTNNLNIFSDEGININGVVKINTDIDFRNKKFTQTDKVLVLGGPGTDPGVLSVIGFLTIKIHGEDYKIPLVEPIQQ